MASVNVHCPRCQPRFIGMARTLKVMTAAVTAIVCFSSLTLMKPVNWSHYLKNIATHLNPFYAI